MTQRPCSDVPCSDLLKGPPRLGGGAHGRLKRRSLLTFQGGEFFTRAILPDIPPSRPHFTTHTHIHLSPPFSYIHTKYQPCNKLSTSTRLLLTIDHFHFQTQIRASPASLPRAPISHLRMPRMEHTHTFTYRDQFHLFVPTHHCIFPPGCFY